ncbi:MAG: hypothetical protein ABSH25_07900 [Syntrophorhabdales bacterium]|jgi:hypothetical protein
MKNPFVRCLILVSGLLIAAYCVVVDAQETRTTGQVALSATPPDHEDFPPLAASRPGLYVNGWPVFTLAYPENWIEETPSPVENFHVSAPGPAMLPALSLSVFPTALPLEQSVKIVLPGLGRIGRDIKVLYEKPTQLKDGRPAYEGQIEWTHNVGLNVNSLLLATKKDDICILTIISDLKETVGVDRKGIAYSLSVKRGNEEPVSLPPDVQGFLDKTCRDFVSHDMARIMGNYSDRFRDYGRDKARLESDLRTFVPQLTSCEMRLTIFERQGEKASVAGYFTTNLLKVPVFGSAIMKEGGEWK